MLKSFPLLLLLALLASCGPTEAREQDERYLVVTTIGMIADIAAQIAGPHGEVVALMGPGSDPHLYTPRRADIARLSRADLILYHGLQLEGNTNEALKAQRSRVPVVAVGERIAESYPILAGDAGGPDPHVWMDVAAWKIAVDVIAEALISKDPGNADEYRAEARRIVEEMEELDRRVAEAMETVPERNRVLVTAHDAFSYFGRAYGIEVRGIQGISTESEAGLRDINQLVDLLVERRIPAVFVESTVPQRAVRSLVEGAASRGHQVSIGGELHSDALGPAGSEGATYIGMIRHNCRTIVAALGGDPSILDAEPHREAAIP